VYRGRGTYYSYKYSLIIITVDLNERLCDTKNAEVENKLNQDKSL